MRLKLLFFIALAVFLPSMHLHAAWMMDITMQNLGSGGSVISAIASFGENTAAADGWDWQCDIPIFGGPMNGSYVLAYFPHSDWGVNNGNYNRDIRSATPGLKTWSATLKASSPLSYIYLLSWEIPASMPQYYSPKLIFDSQTINMRNVSSFSYRTASATTNCSFRLDFNPGVPYLLAPFEDMHFSDNLPESINLNQHFAVLSGNLTLAYTANEHLNQSIQTVGSLRYWQVQPLPGWQGSTTATLSATGTSGTTVVNIGIVRDSTNSPPEISLETNQLTIMQNQSVTFSWANQVYDVDFDDLRVSIQGTSNFQVMLNDVLQEAVITPTMGYKGTDTLSFTVSDEINPTQTIPLLISVNPAPPLPPINISIIPSEGELLCTWEAVLTDAFGYPIQGLRYRVTCHTDPECITPPYFSLETSNQFAQIPATATQLFVKIISINE
ncbi:MAG: hypothetical protein PHO32_02180 [Candidatus Cloacimonetes bacterium]|nr:hypothetical protein [Candidatus Cloacimonadota bacterium]